MHRQGKTKRSARTKKQKVREKEEESVTDRVWTKGVPVRRFSAIKGAVKGGD